MTPDELRAALLGGDLSRPRLTWYDDARAERIDLTGKTLATWVAKAGHWLDGEAVLEPGDLLSIDLPGRHWRAIYWSLAAWSRGLTVTSGTGDARVAWDGAGAADLSEPRAALARSPLQALPDVFPVPVGAVPTDLVALTGDQRLTYRQVALPAGASCGDRVALTPATPGALVPVTVAALMAAGCSAVVVPQSAGSHETTERIAAEGVDLVL